VKRHHCQIDQVTRERDALRDALRSMLAEKHPFLSKEKGGLGLPYVSEQLTIEAWEARSRKALRKARAALALCKRDNDL
jgi:hypothetical protein